MKYSIITVTYNCASTIRRTIKSVLKQDCKNYEYIIIDGASSDGTKEIIEEYADYLSYYVSEPDDGIYFAMNKGIDRARGEYIYFLNGDDYFCNESTLSRVEKHISNCKRIVIGKVLYGDKESVIDCIDEAKSVYFDVSYPHQATFVPRVLFEKIGKYDINYTLAADYEWICRAIYNGYMVQWIDERISYYSTDGRSTAMQFIIDQYLVSNKYMSLTDDIFIEDMIAEIIERAKNKIYETKLKDTAFVERILQSLEEMIGGHVSTISLWGAGYWSGLFMNVFEMGNIEVEYIIDKTGSGDVRGVRVIGYSRDCIKRTLISTEKYDDEIAESLTKEGFVEGIDFYSFHRLRDKVFNAVDKDDSLIVQFENQTGMKLT